MSTQAVCISGGWRFERLSLTTLEVHPILNLRYERDSFSAGLMESTPKIVTRLGIDPAEAEARVIDLNNRTSEGDYFFSLNRYLFLARRNELRLCGAARAVGNPGRLRRMKVD